MNRAHSIYCIQQFHQPCCELVILIRSILNSATTLSGSIEFHLTLDGALVCVRNESAMR